MNGSVPLKAPQGDEWHVITTIHDGVDGLILCVIDIQIYDLKGDNTIHQICE
jgi:hypothetical protein